jgi:hypothetical protein
MKTKILANQGKIVNLSVYGFVKYLAIKIVFGSYCNKSLRSRKGEMAWIFNNMSPVSSFLIWIRLSRSMVQLSCRIPDGM